MACGFIAFDKASGFVQDEEGFAGLVEKYAVTHFRFHQGFRRFLLFLEDLVDVLVGRLELSTEEGSSSL